MNNKDLLVLLPELNPYTERENKKLILKASGPNRGGGQGEVPCHVVHQPPVRFKMTDNSRFFGALFLLFKSSKKTSE